MDRLVQNAAVIVIARHRRDVSMMPATCASQVLVVLACLPFVSLGSVSGPDWAILAALGIGQMGVGLAFLTIGARLIPPAQVAVISLLEVVLGPLWVWLAYEERPSLATFLGGNTDMVTVPINEGLPYVQSGKAKVIAMLTAERQTAPELKDIPTAKEQGIDVVWGQVMGMLAPPNLDPAVAKWWEEKIVALSQTEEWKKFVAENYYGADLVVGERIKGYLDDVHQKLLAALERRV